MIKCLISCFHYYCIKLKKRIDYVKDPATFCDKDHYSNDLNYLSKKLYTRFKNSHQPPQQHNQKNNKDNINLNTSLYSVDTNSLISSIKSSSFNLNKAKKKTTNLNTKNLNQQQQTKKNIADIDKDDNEDHYFPEIDETQNQDLQTSMETVLSETNVENYETDIEEKNSIRKNQEWPIHSFCFKLIDTLIDNMSLILIKNNKNILNNNFNYQLQTSMIPIICETINNLIDILYETKSEWKNQINLNETLVNLFKKLDHNIKYASNRSQDSSQHSNKHLNMFNRILYTYFVITLFKIIQLMHSIEESNILMPTDLNGIIFYILNDICLVDSFPTLTHLFSSLLAHLDKSLFDVYILSNEICESMKCACDFLLKHNQLDIKEDLIRMAKKSLNYMDYHICKDLPRTIIEFCSKIINLDQDDSNNKSDLEYLITSCMISKSDEIRIETYSTISRIVNDSINVQIATEINSKRYKRINFLLLNKIFYQLIAFGLFDKCFQVKKYCENILSHLLQCELLVPESFRLKLTQLIVIYMPFIQCFASQTDSLGQCILKMSDDHLTPINNNKNSSSLISRSNEDGLKLFLTPAVERLRCSLRYLYSKDKNLRKKGYLQTIGFMTKYNSAIANDNDDEENDNLTHQSIPQIFNLNEFYLRFLPDKFCDIAVKLKRRNKTFSSNDFSLSNNQHTVSIFQTDNLLRIYNIFTSESVDYEVKQNAGEQLAIMMSTGDSRLHKAFINLDGVNYCIRLLQSTLFSKSNEFKSKHLFLTEADKETLNKIQSSCLTCLCHILYYNKELRLIYLFDVDFYRLIFKCLLVSHNIQLKQSELGETAANNPNSQFDHVLYSVTSNIQEDASIILFTLLYNQVSSLDYYYEYESTVTQASNKFDLNLNLKDNLIIPFNINTTNANGNVLNNEIKQMEKQQWQAYEYNFKLTSIFNSKMSEEKLNILDSKDQFNSLKKLLDKKFRLYWNFRYHGGSLKKICNELITNEQMVLNKMNATFNADLCLNECDKCEIKYSNPLFLFKQLSSNINTCTTHQEALCSLDLIQILITVCDETKFKFNLDENDQENLKEEDEIEFYLKNSLNYYFNRYKCDWHLAVNRFTSILPSNKSRLDQLLYSNSFQTISKLLNLQMKLYDSNSYLNKSSKILDSNKQIALLNQNESANQSTIEIENLNSLMLIDKWLYNMIYNPNSSLLLMIKQFLITYESDETRINSYILPLCEFLKVYFDRLCLLNQVNSIDYLLPPIELLKICIEQIQACEIEKFRNLNKLAILINLIGSLLRVCLFNKSNENNFFPNNKDELNLTINNAFANNNNKIFIQLIKSLVQIINTFNIGRGGLSLSFMGNFITKSAHISLLQLIKNCISSDVQNSQNNIEIVKAVICLKDQKSSLHGSSWLIPLMLHREPQIRSISFSLISVLINVPFAKSKFVTNQNGIWSIALSVLLNRNECSIVRIQACAFLINLTQSMINNSNENLDENNITLTNLQYLLHEFNFYQQIAYILSTFYPFETYSLQEIKQKSGKKSDNKNDEISICSPLLVSSICQLLYNLNILLKEEALILVNKNSIISLLTSYVKPVSLLTKNRKSLNNDSQSELKLNENLIEMLQYILIYFNLCCQMDQNCVIALLKTQSNHKNMVHDLVESLSLNANNKDKLRPFFSILFELLSTFLNYYDDKAIVENCLIIISRSWLIISDFILNEILDENSSKRDNLENLAVKSTMDIYQSQLFENSLKFYSIYLSKLAQLCNESENIQILNDNIAYLFDLIDEEGHFNHKSEDPSTKTLGGKMCKKLIKQFDKYFLVNTNQNFKLIISNVIKGLFAISDSAKKVAVDLGLIETLVEHLKYTHSKLNLKSLSTKGTLKDNTFINDLQQTLLILKFLMCNSPEIKVIFEFFKLYLNRLLSLNKKEMVTKSNLHSIIHSFWCWAIQDQNLLKASLSTLCTLTANNKQAINFMAQSNISAQTTSNTINSNLTGLSLLFSIIKTLQKLLSSLSNQNNLNNMIILKFAFSLLTNCAQSNECKNIIWKVIESILFQIKNINKLSMFSFLKEQFFARFRIDG